MPDSTPAAAPLPNDPDADVSVMDLWGSARWSARVALALAAGAACLIFSIGSGQFGVPALRGFDGSLLAQPSPIVALFLIAVMLCVSTLVGTIIARNIHLEAGLFAAAIGLMVITFRCGDIQSVLFESGGSQTTFVWLMLETLILGGFMVGIWVALCRALGERPFGSPGADVMNHVSAVLTQVVATGVVMLILCQTEAKNQCLASVAVASMVGSALAYKYAQHGPSILFWTGPMIVGLIGYALGALGQVSNLNIGLPTGAVAPLLRPLPIDYASVGTAGAILSYWIMSAKPDAD